MTFNCPWSALRSSGSIFCEEQLCSWIKEPANTWSNVGFIVIGIWILLRSCRDQENHLSYLGGIAVLTGLGSGFFHASKTFVGELIDYLGMFSWLFFMLMMCFRRMWQWSGRRLISTFFVLLIASSSLHVLVPNTIRTIFTLGVAMCGIMDLVLFRRDRESESFRPMMGVWCAFGAGYVLWEMDQRHIWCDPKNHWINGHALWHLLNALTFYFLFRYYRQFSSLAGSWMSPTNHK